MFLPSGLKNNCVIWAAWCLGWHWGALVKRVPSPSAAGWPLARECHVSPPHLSSLNTLISHQTSNWPGSMSPDPWEHGTAMANRLPGCSAHPGVGLWWSPRTCKTLLSRGREAEENFLSRVPLVPRSQVRARLCHAGCWSCRCTYMRTVSGTLRRTFFYKN